MTTTGVMKIAIPHKEGAMREGMAQKILVPTDMSDFSRAAAAWAAMFHETLGSSITLLFANEPWVPLDIFEASAQYAMESRIESHDLLSKELRGFASECFPAFASSVNTLIVDAAPAQAIVASADRIGADLIIMGTHARHGWRRALSGSVTEAVVRATSKVVLSIGAAGETEGTPVVKRILCPVNLSAMSRNALKEAVALASVFEAELIVLYVTDMERHPFFNHLEHEFARWVDSGVLQRCRYSQIVKSGHAADEVLTIADQSHADLIVLGAQHRRFSDITVIGSTSEQVVRSARQPVWTVVAPVQAVAHRDHHGMNAGTVIL